MLAAIGSIGPALVVGVSLIGLLLHFIGVRVDDWVFAHNLGGACMIGAGFLLGFIIRLVFASRFELRITDAPLVFWSHLWSAFALFWVEKSLLIT